LLALKLVNKIHLQLLSVNEIYKNQLV